MSAAPLDLVFTRACEDCYAKAQSMPCEKRRTNATDGNKAGLAIDGHR